MSGTPPDFTEALLNSLRGQTGPCPETEDILAFTSGDLTPERHSAIARHIGFCGACELVVERLHNQAEEITPGELAASKQRLTAALAPILNAPHRDPQTPWSSAAAFLRNPAVAYSCAAVALAAALLRPVTRPLPPAAVATNTGSGFYPAQKLDLDVTRSPSDIRVTPTSEVLILSFMLPVRSKTEYTASLSKGEGDPVGPPRDLSVSGDGYFYVVVPRTGLGRGSFKLVVSERAPGTARHFDFPFTLQ